MKVFIIHGWEGKPEGAWRPWLKQALEEKGFQVEVPAMPSPLFPIKGKWVSHLSQVVGQPEEDTIFVGHSLGCITILRYLETVGREVGGAVLVAGFSDNLGFPLIDSFFKDPINWEAIRTHCKKFVAIHSDDDPYVPLKQGDMFRENLGAKVVVKKGMKHFSGDECRELPAALEAVLEVSKLI